MKRLTKIVPRTQALSISLPNRKTLNRLKSPLKYGGCFLFPVSCFILTYLIPSEVQWIHHIPLVKVCHHHQLAATANLFSVSCFPSPYFWEISIAKIFADNIYQFYVLISDKNPSFAQSQISIPLITFA